jgi:hypothetical protein
MVKTLFYDVRVYNVVCNPMGNTAIENFEVTVPHREKTYTVHRTLGRQGGPPAWLAGKK